MNPAHKTLCDVFLDRIGSADAKNAYIRHKPVRGGAFETITYATFVERAEQLARSLVAYGIQRGDRIAIISESRPEWLITDFAALLIGAITVPVFPTLTPKQVEHILADSGARLAVVSNDLQFGKVARSLPACPALEKILACTLSQPVPSDLLGRVVMFSDFADAAVSADVRQEARKAREEDVITIIYTSGTTGLPKGVMLTHGNVISNIAGAFRMLPPVTHTDSILSFLPLSHSFERVASYLIFTAAASIAFAESIDTVAENMLEIRPTFMTGVPRFYERIYARIMRMREKMPEKRKKIFDWAMRVGSDMGRRYEGERPSFRARVRHPIADKLVLRKVRARTGGRIRFFVSGSAALPAEVGRAFAAFGLPIIEGYGMTESSPIISVSPFRHLKWGAVGKRLPNIEVKIAADGEILTRGPHVMKGYYNDPVATREMIDDEGWLHTGDVGEIDPDGYIRITDRKKHLFVSSGGKNIAPGPIESVLVQSQFIEQVMLVGDKRQFCTALIVPDYEVLKDHLRTKGFDFPNDHRELVSYGPVLEIMEQEIDRFQKDLANFERVRRFALLPEPFTIENSMMTPTLKIKRREVEKRYGDLIESLYQTGR